MPFGLQRSYATSMGYVNLTSYLHQLFPEADTWALVLAGFGVVLAVLLRSRFGLTVTVLGAAFALAEVFDPQGSLYNVRLLPMWFVSVYLMAAWAFGAGCILLARGWRRAKQLRWEQWEASFREPALVAATGDGDEVIGSVDGNTGVGGPESPHALRGLRAPATTPAAAGPGRGDRGRDRTGGRDVGRCASLSDLELMGPGAPRTERGDELVVLQLHGVRGAVPYPEYRAVIGAMEQVSKHYGCGRTMWEYSDSENRFGTPEALMLLPYWTNGCIDSMEGLLFESSATTPLPLHQPGRALHGAVRARGRAALRGRPRAMSRSACNTSSSSG